MKNALVQNIKTRTYIQIVDTWIKDNGHRLRAKTCYGPTIHDPVSYWLHTVVLIDKQYTT